MNNDAIGVFDSGIGGLTSAKELRALLPNEDIIYFGDTARIPYGTKSKETIQKFARQDINFLKSHRVKMIIAACGTVSSTVNLAKLDIDIPCIGVMLPAIQTACTATKNGRIGIIGTNATIKNGNFGKTIRTIRPDTFVVGNSCQLLVSLAEYGFSKKGNPISRMALEYYLAPIQAENVDTLILGCTHFPIFSEDIAEIMGKDVTLISPGAEAAKFASALLTSKELLSDRKTNGTTKFFVSDSVELFKENAKTFLGHEIEGNVEKVNIEAVPD